MKKKLVYIISITCFIMCSLKLIIYYVPSTLTSMKYSELSIHKNMQPQQLITNTEISTETQNNILWEFQKINSDLVGWISIPDTNIDYPVMQTTDNIYYLNHDLWRNYSPAGVPFIDYEISPMSDNIIIYGHNMKNGTMFADLIHYKNETFCKEHPLIKFETLETCKYYQIVSVAIIDVNHTQSLSFTEFVDQEAKKDFLAMINTSSLIRTNVSINENDNFLTLCTCDAKKSDRLLVIAKEIEL